MKKIFCVFIFCILVLCGCSTGVEKGKIPFSPEEIRGKDYEYIVDEFEKEGFTNIKTIALLNLETETEEILENKIDAITIGDEATFKKDKKIALDTEITITYHSYAERNMIITSEDAKGKSYEEVMDLVSQEGFFNVQSQLIRDVDNDNVYDEEVEYITIGESERYSLEDSYSVKTEIIIFYSLLEQSMPITSEEAKGKEYNEVVDLFSESKFAVEYKLVKDNDGDNVYEDEIEYIEIDSQKDYTLEENYPIKTKVTVYHSYLEDTMPITSDAAKGKTYQEVLNLFKNKKFQNVTVKSSADSENVEAKETSVDKIVVNNSSDYSVKESYPYNSEIVIHYSIKKYNVVLELECLESGFFSPEYDILVYVDNKKLGTLEYSKSKSFKVELEKGKYELVLKSAEDSSITGKGIFEVKSNGTLRYEVSCKSSAVGMTYHKSLKIPYTSNEANGKHVADVVKAYEDAGFKKVTTKAVNDLDENNLEKSNTVSKILINNSSDFTKSSRFYADSVVEIYYHAGNLIEVPVGYYDAEGQEYEEIVSRFKDAGFLNVSAEIYTGNYNKKARNNIVHSVEINGDDYFSEGSKESLDSNIVVYYYSINYDSCSVSTMMNDLEKNAYNAKEYYDDKYVSVSGWVSDIDSYGKEFELVSSSSGWDFIGVTCEIVDSEQKALISKLTTGKKVTVKGKITLVTEMGYYLDIHDIAY